MPLGLTSSPFYGLAGTGTVLLSTGESFVFSPAFRAVDVGFLWRPQHTEPFPGSNSRTTTTYLVLDNFSYLPGAFTPGQPCPTSISTTIDIKPDSPNNPVNPKSNGMLQVVVFGSPGLDTSQIDVASLRLGVTGLEAAPRKNYSYQDVNLDGEMDLVLHFRIPETGITCTTNQLLMTGQMLSGLPLTGSDIVTPVGCKP